MKLALVTGATGFIGRELVRLLERKGIKVIKFSRSIGLDLLDKNQVEEHVRRADEVYHLAARTVQCPDLFEVNVTGTRNVAEACLKHGVRMLFMSTAGVHGPCKKQVNERDPLNPPGPYEASKVIAEEVVREYVHEGLDATIVRSSLVYGPNRYFSMVFRLIKKGFPLVGGENKFHVIHVKDAALGIYLGMENGRVGQAYIIAGPEVPTLKDFYLRACELLGARPKVIPKVLGYPLVLFYDFFRILKGKERLFPLIKRANRPRWYDIRKAKKELGFEPKIRVKKGLRMTIRELGL